MEPGIRTMSYNIRFDTPVDGVHAWPHRREKLASLIRFHGADLIGLQEAVKGQVDDLQSLLPGFEWTGEGREGGVRGEFCPIFYRRERLELLEHGTFWLSESPEAAGSIGWDAELPRVVSWGRFRDVWFDLEFFHFNTHFDHRGVRALSESASLLCRRIDQISRQLPCIVSGDFIGDERSEVYALLTDYLEDTYVQAREGHYGPDASFFGGGFEVTEATGERLDYIFSRGGLQTKRHATLSDSWDGFYPSDHLPVLAEFLIPSTP